MRWIATVGATAVVVGAVTIFPAPMAQAAPGGDVTTVVKSETWGASGADTVMCPVGTRAVGGGAAPVIPTGGYESRLRYDGPVNSSGGAGTGDVPAGWMVSVESVPGSLGSWKVFVTCSASSDALLSVTGTNGAIPYSLVGCPAGSRAIAGGLVGTGSGPVITRSGPRHSLAGDFGASADGAVPIVWEVDTLSPDPSDSVVAICSAGSDATLRRATLTVPAGAGGQAATISVGCPGGQRAVSAGLAAGPAEPPTDNRLDFAAPVSSSSELATISTGAVPRAWTIQGRGHTDGTTVATYTAFTICISEPPPPDTTPPNTRLNLGPAKKDVRKKVKFTFTTDPVEPGVTFVCQLDKKPAVPCTSPYKVKKLKPGKHRFSVAAKDAAGNIDPTPAVDKWKTVKKPKPKPPHGGGCTGECRLAAGGYTTYVACSTKTSAKPATQCKLSQTKAAFFRSGRHDATYKVCVKFPGKKKRLCASAQEAAKGATAFVTIATADTGKHKITWYVAGKKVGGWKLDVVSG